MLVATDERWLYTHLDDIPRAMKQYRDLVKGNRVLIDGDKMNIARLVQMGWYFTDFFTSQQSNWLAQNWNQDCGSIRPRGFTRMSLKLGFVAQATLVVQAYREQRLAGVRKLLEINLQVPFIHSAILVWNGDPEHTGKNGAEINATLHGLNVVLVHETVNSLNNRFKPSLPISTPGVLITDDDCFLQPESLLCLWRAWNQQPQVCRLSHTLTSFMHAVIGRSANSRH